MFFIPVFCDVESGTFTANPVSRKPQWWSSHFVAWKFELNAQLIEELARMPYRKLLDWEFLRRENSATETQIWRFSSSISFMFIPNFGEDEPNLTSIFFRWVGSKLRFSHGYSTWTGIWKSRKMHLQNKGFVIDTTHLEVVVVQSSRDVSLSFPP